MSNNNIDGFYTLKGAGFIEGQLQKGSYAISTSNDGAHPDSMYSFKICAETCIAKHFGFVFGYSGVGRHYRVTFDLRSNHVFLYLVRDGINVYLHHVKFSQLEFVEVEWTSVAIRIFVDGECLIGVFENELKRGGWGFYAEKGGVALPEVHVSSIHVAYDWVCFGDGFSNARWKNRCFLSWPELLTKGSQDFLNLCIAAGNSNRVLDVVRRCPSSISNQFIFAVGNDDLIEKHGVDDYLRNLKNAVDYFESATRTVVCSLTPRRSSLTDISQWNERLKEFVAAQEGWIYVDVFTPLYEQLHRSTNFGEYPNEYGQKIMAETIGDAIGVRVLPLDIRIPKKAGFLNRVTRQILAIIYGRLGKILGVIE